jgi:hypothetical protein
MPVTILYQNRPPFVVPADADGEDLWLSLADFQAATGWDLKPEGACLGDMCVPIAPGVVSGDGRQANLPGFARWLGQPVVHDDARAVWVFGEAASTRRAALESLRAPDFTLTDLEGRRHSISEYRGRKVFLVSWASW